MHHYINAYYFIADFNKSEILNLDIKITLIFRNYHQTSTEKEPIVLKIKQFCKKNNRKFLISNDLKLALKLNLDGLYIPAFNNLLKYKNLNKRANFKIIGSAHNRSELIRKKIQGCEEIFISPIFKSHKNKSFLGVCRFNLIDLGFNIPVVALGGINGSNLKKIKLTRSVGFASISWIKKNQPKIN